ncbi:adenylate/guanylate cyclase domain-containing protein [Erythrobacter dokdonensis]|nr:adenylate/guanylate cyclase domain-containing protein [Erythrobacter dokdonensis]
MMSEEAASIRQSIATLEAQRDVLGPAVIEPAIKALQQQLAALQARQQPAVDEDAERKVVTVMFADISGFTALSEALDAEEVRAIMNDCFAELVPCIERYDGVVDKFIGDAVMALFGAPYAHEDDPRRALLAAIEMRASLDAFNSRRGLSLGIHFGINTGEVVAGGVGSSSRQDYSVMGDAVNVAARLEDASQTGEILVGPETYRQTEAEFEFEHKPRMRLKGKSEEISIHALIRRRLAPRQRIVAASVLVGRDEEVTRLCCAVDLLREDRGGSIMISGEAGLGKSRLLAEALSYAGVDVRSLLLVCQPHGETLGYGLLRHLIRHLIGAETNPDPAKMEQALHNALGSVASEGAQPDMMFIKLVAGLTITDAQLRVLQSLPGPVFEERMADALAVLLQAEGTARPLLLGIEDLHWADTSSLRLLARIAERAVPRVLLVATTRPGSDADRLFGHECDKIVLSPLDEEKSRAMLANLLGGAEAEILHAVVDRAEGNPFFLEEFAAIIGEHRASGAVDGSGLGIPNSIRSLVGARLDRLPSQGKRLLQVASVVGRSFDAEVVGQLAALGRQEEYLAQLVAQDIVHSHSDEQGHARALYAFRHALTHEAAYRSLLLRRRRELHLKLARLFSDQGGLSRDVSAAIISHHFEQAADYAAAGEYLLEAARDARNVFANREALAFYDRALGLPYPDEQAARRLMIAAHRGLGELLERTGKFAEAETNLAQALGLLDPSDHLVRAALLRGIGQTWIARRDAHRSLALYADATEALARVTDRVPAYWQEWCDLLLDRLWALYWANDIDGMRRLVAESAAHFETHGTAAQHSRFMHRQLLIRFRDEGREIRDETVDLAKACIVEAERLDDPVWLSQVTFSMGLALLWREAHDQCRHWLCRSLDLARVIGNAEYEVLALTYLAVSHRLEGKTIEVETLAREAKARATVSRMELYVGVALANEAWVALRQGRDGAARELAKAALSRWHSVQWPLGWIATGPLFALAVADSDWSLARDLAQGMLAPGQHGPGARFAEAIHALPEKDGMSDCVASAETFEQALFLAREAGVA